MVDIPDVIISKPLKFAHDAFSVLAGLTFLVAAVNLLATNIGTAILYGIVTIVFAKVASKIKFKWTLRGGAVVYE
jgi:cell division protein FtsW (lipid II flippase)